jgi:hypothetical protein
MPISVVCPGCKARFSVSDKFAGKKGPCPKCKAQIVVPAAPVEEVKIHVPEVFASGGKDSKGRAVSKPILREEMKVKPLVIGGIVTAVVAMFVVAVLLRNTENKLPIIAAGLLVISPPLAAAGYTFLREDELEPYRGRSLFVRSTLCGLAYIALWGLFMPLPAYGLLTGEAWQWVFVAPVFISIGAAAAWACLDLDFGSAAMHYSFYVLVTVALRAAIGLPPLWNLGGGGSS